MTRPFAPLLALILLASCGGVAAPSPGSSAAASPAACGPDQIVARFRGWNGATGSLQGTIGLGNRGTAACVLDGYPRLRLLDARGSELDVDRRVWETFAKPEPAILAPGTGDVPDRGTELRRGQASFGFMWANWCGTATPAAIGASVASTELVVPATAEAPRCDAASARSMLSVGPFEPVR